MKRLPLKKIFGILIVILFFTALFLVVARQLGYRDTLIMFLGSFGITAIIVLAIFLIND